MSGLAIRAERLQAKIDCRAAVVGVVGLGMVGSVTARLIADAGLRVIGVDSAVERISPLRAVLANIELHTDIAALAEADIVMVAVRAEVSDGGTDVSTVRSVFDSLRQHLREPALLLLESTVPPGTTRELAHACFGPESLQAALTCHCPERLRVGEDIATIRATPRLVGGLSETGTALALRFLAQVGITGVAASGPEATELAKLLENAFLTTGIALMGEVTRIAHGLGVSAQEVARIAATKPQGYYPFQPGAGIGGHCLINDLRMLRESAASAGVESDLLAGVDRAAEQLNLTVVRRLEHLLDARNIPMREAVICLVGVGFKADSSDVTHSAATDVARHLLSRGASVAYADSLVPEFVVDGTALTRVPSPLALERADAVLLLSGDRQLDVESVVAHVPVVLDAGGARIMQGRAHQASAL